MDQQPFTRAGGPATADPAVDLARGRSALPAITATPAAERVVVDARRAHGPQVLVLTSSGAARSIIELRPAQAVRFSDRLIPVGMVARCVVLAHPARIKLCPHEGIAIDIGGGADGSRLIARPESDDEWSERHISRRIGL